jgi:hypothetical protein
LLPQAPQVSHGDSSTRLITVPLLVGVGEGEAPGVGVGLGAPFDGTELALVEEDVFPPHEASIRASTKIREQV